MKRNKANVRIIYRTRSRYVLAKGFAISVGPEPLTQNIELDMTDKSKKRRLQIFIDMA